MSLLKFLVNNLYITFALLIFYHIIGSIGEQSFLPRSFTVFGFIIMYFAVLPVHGLVAYGGKKK